MGRNRPLAWLIIAVMAIGSVFMWLGVPALWIFIASRIASSQQPGMGIYVMLIVGIPASIALVGKGLSMLNRSTRASPTPRRCSTHATRCPGCARCAENVATRARGPCSTS